MRVGDRLLTYTPIEPGQISDHHLVTVTLYSGDQRDLYDPVVTGDAIKWLLYENGTAVYYIRIPTRPRCTLARPTHSRRW